MSGVADRDVDTYMQAAARAILGALLTPPENTQIGAVILMTDLIPLEEVLPDGQTSPFLGRWSRHVRNPNGSLHSISSSQVCPKPKRAPDDGTRSNGLWAAPFGRDTRS